jgi:hypothetical protein
MANVSHRERHFDMSCAASQLSSAFKSGTTNLRANRIAPRKIAARAVHVSAEMKTVSLGFHQGIKK